MKTEGVICRLQVAGCRLQVAGYTSQVAIMMTIIIIIVIIIMIIIIIIMIIIIIVIIINAAGITANLREYIHTYALMNVRTGYECPSPEDSLRWGKLYNKRQGCSQKQIMTNE